MYHIIITPSSSSPPSRFSILYFYLCVVHQYLLVGRGAGERLTTSLPPLGLMSSTHVTSILSSDALVGCLFLVAIAIISLKLLPVGLVPGRYGTALGISTAATAYESYEKTAKSSARKMRTAFHAGLRTARGTKLIAKDIGYAEKLERLEKAIEVNAVVSGGIYTLATTEGETSLRGKDTSLGLIAWDAYVGAEDHAKVKEALKHFVRDWSEEGRKERCQTFGMVLDALKRLESEVSGRRKKRVLVPGAGLGRLAWEISQLGSSPRRLSAPGLRSIHSR